jgi:hypothetical protein
MNLGKLERVDLRKIWESEDKEFTPWLAENDNIKLLGDAVGLDLEMEAQEKDVGPFRADILCKDTSTNHWVLIENQLERTDHTHLGQLMTYAAGLNAVTIIWIAQKFTEEHRAALDWLNEITDREFNFFGLEIELWKIGSSPIAPKFNVICKPNDWIKTVSEAKTQIQSGNLSETKKLQLEYWTEFRKYVLNNSTILKPQKPLPQHWANFSIGRSYFLLISTMNTWDKQITVYLDMTGENAKPHYYLLEQKKKEIEGALGFAVEWRELPDKKESHLTIRIRKDPTNRNDWPEQHKWLLEHLEKFHKVCSPIVKKLNANDYKPDHQN